MEPDVIANLIEAAEQYYDATFDLHDADQRARAADQHGTPHDVAHAQCILHGERAKTLRASGEILRAVKAYRKAKDTLTTDETEE